METPFEEAARSFDALAFERRLRTLPRRDPFLFPSGAVPEGFSRSSVMICFWRDASDLRVLLTKRASTMSRHAGQMAFPGGRLDEGEDWIAAALRETEEEVGIEQDRIEILGRLDDAWSGAGHWLVPIVGWLDRPPSYSPNPAEVDEIHEPRVSALLMRDAYEEEVVQLDDGRFTNATLRWPEGHVFGLSTDLLIEALQWGLELEGLYGPRRLESLRAYLRMRAKSESEETGQAVPRRPKRDESEEDPGGQTGPSRRE